MPLYAQVLSYPQMRLLAVILALSCVHGIIGYTPMVPGSEVAPRTATDRRSFLTSAVATTVAAPALAADTATAQQRSSLEARSAENISTFPDYGMDGSDIFYPPWFLGSYKAVSTTKQVFAPCGTDLFTGGKAAYDNVIETEVQKGDALEYRARFIQQLADGENSYVAADREYNAREIAKAAMGGYSMVDVPVATPNQFSCTLGGNEQSSFVNVDITTLKRKAEVIDERKFACSELVRQIVSNPDRGLTRTRPWRLCLRRTLRLYRSTRRSRTGGLSAARGQLRTLSRPRATPLRSRSGRCRKDAQWTLGTTTSHISNCDQLINDFTTGRQIELYVIKLSTFDWLMLDVISLHRQ